MSAPERRPRILLVEEDTRAARRLAHMLHEDGFDVEITGDGADAVARLSASPPPEVLVTDMFIPSVDGLALSRVARGRSPAIPTVLITGHAELVRRRATADELPLVFVKPVDYEALAKALHGLFAPGG